MLDGLGTYALADFVPIGRETWHRLFVLHNRALWPAHLAALAAGLGILWLAWRPPRGGGPAVLLILAAAWGWVAWAFLLQRYAPLNWAASWMAVGFAGQALLLAGTAALGRPRIAARRAGDFRVGFALAVLGVLLQPLLGLLAGRAWAGLGLFGMTPAPSVIVTLGVVLMLAGRRRWELLALPVLWCVPGGVTAWVLEAWDGLVPVAAAVLALGVAAARPRGGSPPRGDAPAGTA